MTESFLFISFWFTYPYVFVSLPCLLDFSCLCVCVSLSHTHTLRVASFLGFLIAIAPKEMLCTRARPVTAAHHLLGN